MELSIDNPFLPGAGNLPPVRAGHETAASTLRMRLRRILARKQGDIVVLFGPRGNGKTTLITELMLSVKKDEGLVRTLESEKMDRPLNEVAEHLVRGDVRPKRQVKKAGVKILDTGGDVEMGDVPKFGIMEALASLSEEKPLLLCVDEAHEVCPKFGKHLLQAAQSCISRKLPLLLVLAGTPLVKSNLSSMGASFWERCTRLPIGRLESDDEVRKALAQPAKDSGMPFDADALELLVAESQRYPYFVQMLGHYSWQAAAGTDGMPTAITLADARRGIELAEGARNMFYEGRWDEALRQKVLDYAEAVSKAMVDLGDDGRIQKADLLSMLEDVSSGLEMTAIEAQDKLEHLGLIWRGTDGAWEPGIPSLCSYFVRQRTG